MTCRVSDRVLYNLQWIVVDAAEETFGSHCKWWGRIESNRVRVGAVSSRPPLLAFACRPLFFLSLGGFCGPPEQLCHGRLLGLCVFSSGSSHRLMRISTHSQVSVGLLERWPILQFPFHSHPY